MDKRLYIDIHVIQAVPPSCMNRDDTGSPKTAIYGGVRRARVSSQSWKRAMRSEFINVFDQSELSIRTKRIIDVVSEQITIIDSVISKDKADDMAKDIIEVAGIPLKENKNKKNKNKENKEKLEAQALFFLSTKQAKNLARLSIDGVKNKKTVQDALKKDPGIDIALFGRMVADEPSLNADASSQVAHSISTHKVENEYDYYTAVDERSPENNAGAGMIGTVEFNSSTLYRYATVAAHDLFRQLASDEETAKAIVEFVRAFVVSMPTGKQNTFANRTLPDAVFISVRGDQPINLVGAFESPIRHDEQHGGYTLNSAKKLAEYEEFVCNTFAQKPMLTLQIGRGLESLGDSVDLQTALDTLEQHIRTGL